MIITFIMAAMNDCKKYIKTWQMEPIGVAQAVALTPADVQVKFYDDRVEKIDYDTETDYVAISVETYSAQRTYNIAKKFQKRGKKVLLAGFHPTLVSEEAMDYADSILIGQAENIWAEIIEDMKKGELKKVYQGDNNVNLRGIFPRRDIFEGRNYMPVTLIENSRGCIFNCQFCSIAAFHKSHCNYRPIEDVIFEVKNAKHKTIFFIDDNIASDITRAKELFKALIPYKIKWISQIATACLEDDELVELMGKSGCLGVLIGFESFNPVNLKQMNKTWNTGIQKYERILKKLTEHNIFVYGTFIFGYDEDTEETFKTTLDFAMRNNLILAAFNHLMPFPGTPLYNTLKDRMLYDKWWLNENCGFADVVFEPKNLTPERLSELCYVYKKKFYSFPSMLKRAWGLRKCLFTHWTMMLDFFKYNIMSDIDTTKRRGFAIGKEK